MRTSTAALARSTRLLSRILRGPVPFEAVSESTEKLRAASNAWQKHIRSCIQRDPDDPYAGLLAHALGSDDEAQRVREEQGYKMGPIPGVLSLHFLRKEAEWRHLPPQKLWPRFQTIAWALHDEVNRVAYSSTRPGRGQLLYVLTRGQEFADGDAGGLCLGIDADGVEFRPFAVIGVTREWHASYEALKETLLHELAHWAVHQRHGHWQTLGPSEVATSGHGDYWRREVHRIQDVFGDFVGFRFLTAASHEQPKSAGRGDMGMYMHAYVCGACSQRLRYASRGSERQRRCVACGTAAMAYIGQQTVVTVVQFDALSQPYASQRNAAWRAYVADSFPAVFARLAADVSHGSATEVSDPTLAADHTASEHSPRVLLSESEAASIREKALQELAVTFSGVHEAVLPCQADVPLPGNSTTVLDTLPWYIALPPASDNLHPHQPQLQKLQTAASTLPIRQQEAPQGSPSQVQSSAAQAALSVDDIASSLDAALKAEVQATGAPTSRRITAFGGSSGHARLLVKRAVGGGARSFESACIDPVPGKRPSLQQRQWYLFQRAAWAEAQREIGKGVETSHVGGFEGGFKGDSTGAVQRLVATWWHEHKSEAVLEASELEPSDAAVSELRGKVETAEKDSTISSTVRATECRSMAENKGRHNFDNDRGVSSSTTREAGANESCTGSSSSRRGGSVTSSSSGRVGSRCSSAGEAEQYARTAHHVWKRFGARAWEAGVTNDEARALHRAWS